MRFIKLYEKMTEWEWYDDTPTLKVFLHLLLTANWKSTRWHGIEIKRGQRVISFRGLAKETNLSEQQVRTAIAHLKSTHEITQVSTHHYTTVTIENYEKYQDSSDTANTATNAQPNTASTSEIEVIEQVEVKNTPTVYKKDRVDEVVDLYNEMCPSLPRTRGLSATRRKHIEARLKEHSMDEITVAFQKAEASDFCTGRKGNSSSRWCNLDWMMKSENNLLKILEDNYANKDSARQKAIRDLGSMDISQEQYEDMERRFG